VDVIKWMGLVGKTLTRWFRRAEKQEAAEEETREESTQVVSAVPTGQTKEFTRQETPEHLSYERPYWRREIWLVHINTSQEEHSEETDGHEKSTSTGEETPAEVAREHLIVAQGLGGVETGDVMAVSQTGHDAQ